MPSKEKDVTQKKNTHSFMEKLLLSDFVPREISTLQLIKSL